MIQLEDSGSTRKDKLKILEYGFHVKLLLTSISGIHRRLIIVFNCSNSVFRTSLMN